MEAQLAEEREKTQQANATCKSLQESLSLKGNECAVLKKSEAALEAANKHAQQLEGEEVRKDYADQKVSISGVYCSACIVHCTCAPIK